MGVAFRVTSSVAAAGGGFAVTIPAANASKSESCISTQMVCRGLCLTRHTEVVELVS